MKRPRKRDLIGRKIVAVEYRPFQSHPHTNPRARAADPVIVLDNGRRLYFAVAETEVGEYGVEFCLTPAHTREPGKIA